MLGREAFEGEAEAVISLDRRHCTVYGMVTRRTAGWFPEFLIQGTTRLKFVSSVFLVSTLPDI